MTTDEIRRGIYKLNWEPGQLDRTDEYEPVALLREIAAQLAELNATLKGQ